MTNFFIVNHYKFSLKRYSVGDKPVYLLKKLLKNDRLLNCSSMLRPIHDATFSKT
ncbi:hypothetical protein IWX83_003022 [Flavobacterium sp. CG_9.1]|nr:hypothetical protein [Flavobacterium sp. CG_9.1]